MPETSGKLPSIPAKRYFTIGEVSELCRVKPHVLRYWEQVFPQIKPLKRKGNRRYYHREDVLVIREIRFLLYEKGFTIPGARLHFEEKREEKIKPQDDRGLKELRQELEAVLAILRR
ncbi:MAG: MerR family transcriptional regulator [Gammaproteobacteria bacterium]|nr:MAG: MerR family transcriptional regulator [Gammaproteobacteria bacterium]